ncbi:MAG: hypothetical protein WEB60_07200 [Terrimicrobiaceae bacterium]
MKESTQNFLFPDWRTRLSRWAFAILGAGCALAVSGKYVGALVLVLLAALAPFQSRRWWVLPAGVALFLPALGFSISPSVVYDQGFQIDACQKLLDYVAVAQGDYGRFFLKTHRPQEEEAETFERRKKFYEELFSVGTLLWESPSGQLQYLQPSIKLYRLPEGEQP